MRNHVRQVRQIWLGLRVREPVLNDMYYWRRQVHVCAPAAAFAHTARVRFEMGVPRAYGFIQPKWEVHGDGAVGDDRILSFDMAWDGYVNGLWIVITVRSTSPIS